MGDLRGREAAEGELRNGKGKQAHVVRLKMDLSPIPQDLAVAQQKVRMRQPPLGVTSLGPRIAEIQIHAGKLIFQKIIAHVIHEGHHEFQVLQRPLPGFFRLPRRWHALGFFQRPQNNGLLPLDGQKIAGRIFCSLPGDKISLAAADL